ncbi:peptidoglycan DD-metalloendopeptidase family protein [Nitrosomonas sp.]|uniref:murein hydrolase activator EnvC family protein n=1 Tax=Nitrosomonas sp. TaxID=42353 RepID=UPI0025E96115|nr:peptidoglycan DD-metalloendopeptidase family protein [Nitrosomonas sp.]
MLLLVNAFSSSSLHAIPQTNRDSQKQLQELRTRIDTLQKDLINKKSSKTKAADTLQKSEQSINDLHKKLSLLAQQQKNTQEKLNRLQQQSIQLQDQVKTGQKQLGNLIYSQHMTKYGDYLPLLLRQRDPDKAARNFYYYSYIAQARSKNIDNLRNQLATLDTLTHERQAQNESLKQIRTKQIQQKQLLELEKNRQSEIVAALSEEVTRQQKKIDELKQDEQRLSQLIDKLNKQLARKKSVPARSGGKSVLRNEKLPDSNIEHRGAFAALKGKLRLPVKGELANRFGSPRESGSIKWQGLFIRSAGGSEVKAIAGGEVIFADWLRGFGNLMILDHGSHYMSLYGNNETILKRVGSKVKSGDTIATVGNSGGNAEAGLYFELRYEGRPFDPLSWVKID